MAIKLPRWLVSLRRQLLTALALDDTHQRVGLLNVSKPLGLYFFFFFRDWNFSDYALFHLMLRTINEFDVYTLLFRTQNGVPCLAICSRKRQHTGT